LATRPIHRNLPRDAPSSQELKLTFSHTQTKTPTEPVTRHDAALRGTAIHACFAHVCWLGDDKLDAKILQKIVEQSIAGEKGNVDPSAIVKEVLAFCEQPEVRKILMRTSYPTAEEIDVEPERRFAVRHQNKLLHGSMDRLVIRRKGNEIVGLEIIDFKTDRRLGDESVSDFLTQRQKVYAPQMEAYRRAAEKLYPGVRNIATKLVFVAVDKVVDGTELQS
jgi:ATP-dependent exoDNAse (exonuclease V) beta subunit